MKNNPTNALKRKIYPTRFFTGASLGLTVVGLLLLGLTAALTGGIVIVAALMTPILVAAVLGLASTLHLTKDNLKDGAEAETVNKEIGPIEKYNTSQLLYGGLGAVAALPAFVVAISLIPLSLLTFAPVLPMLFFGFVAFPPVGILLGVAALVAAALCALEARDSRPTVQELELGEVVRGKNPPASRGEYTPANNANGPAAEQAVVATNVVAADAEQAVDADDTKQAKADDVVEANAPAAQEDDSDSIEMQTFVVDAAGAEAPGN